MLSWVIRGARVFDGSGGPAELADVGLAGGRIVRVGAVDAAELPDAARIFDATGLCLAPGFIDAHSHSDLTLPVHGRAESSLLQGITTEVAGSCGWSLAPVKAETRRAVLQRLLLSLCGIEPGQVDWTWHSFGEYAAHLAQLGTGTNLYPVLGQSMLRAHVVGLQARDATSEETEAMRAMLRQAIAEGCRGLSTGRSYMPGGHAKTAEIVALASELAASGGIYTSHIKNESDAMLDAVREVIEIGRRAGVKVQISHHKAIGPAHFGLVRQSLDLISQAHEQGLDINCDVYPYDFAQVFMMRDGLARSWRSLSAAAYAARLADPAARARLHARLARAKGSLVAAPDNYLLVSADGRPDAAGLSLGEAAARDGQEVFDWCCDLLSATACQVRIAARMDEADVRTVLAHPLTMPGTDAFAIDGVPPAGLPYIRATMGPSRGLSVTMRAMSVSLGWQRPCTSAPAFRPPNSAWPTAAGLPRAPGPTWSSSTRREWPTVPRLPNPPCTRRAWLASGSTASWRSGQASALEPAPDKYCLAASPGGPATGSGRS